MKNLEKFLQFVVIIFLWASSLLRAMPCFAQTVFYNGGTWVSLYTDAVLFVDGHVSNNINGYIHNQGDIYLSGDWTNNETSGCLDSTTGTVILNGASQTIQGTQTTTFNNLDCKGNGTKTLRINTIVGGNNGTLSLHSNAFDLYGNTCIITNSASSAITRTSGYIISETDPTFGYGRIQWNLGNTSSSYTYPFGTVSGTYIPFLYNVSSPGTQTAMGNISVATYPTLVLASANNRPLPSGVNDLNDDAGKESAVTCADRYWIVDETGYSLNPIADITFTYRDEEIDRTIQGSTNNILEDSLRAWLWNGTQWQNPTLGTANPSLNTVTVKGVNSSAPWTLKAIEAIPNECGDFSVPNAFSPNNDGLSDLFILQGWDKCITEFSFVIFDRWGEKVFETEDPAKGWDGIFKGKTMDPAVFAYYINASLTSGEKVKRKGNISLVR